MLTPLVVRSCYSFLRGVPKPEALARRAKEAGLSRLALTDGNGLYGIPSFIDACAKEGIRPLPGVEITGDAPSGIRAWRCVLFPLDRAGFSLITNFLTSISGGPEGPSNAISVSRAAQGAPIKKSLPSRASVAALLSSPAALRHVAALSDDEELLRSPVSAEVLHCLVALSSSGRWRDLAALGREPVASPEIGLMGPEDRDVQRVLFAIARGATVHDIPSGDLDPDCMVFSGVPSENEFLRRAPDALKFWIEGAFEANRRVADAVFSEPFSGFVFPRYEGDIVSEGAAPARGAGATPCAGAATDAAALLEALVRQGAVRRYGQPGRAVEDRIAYELDLIKRKGFVDYFLVVRDIVRASSRICGRGSAAASIVSYCLGITEVDPLRHNLYFDRFLNPGRVDPPDIDVDFAWDERDAVLEAVSRAYGKERVARVANHNCFRAKSALRETARAHGMPDSEISEFERALKVDREAALAAADPDWRAIADLSLCLVGLPRNLGAHSGGIVIVPGKVSDLAPVEQTGNGIRVVAWDKEGVEQAGLVKIDLLGNRSLAVVRDVIADLCARGITIDFNLTNPIDDESTVAMLARGDTMGVFYVESPAMRVLQTKTQAGDFDHLVIHSSIIRPAANRYIDEYVDRLRGKPWKPLHLLLAGLFDESFGILCYQEDVSRAAVALAGFSSSKADGIRKILAKKDADTRLQEYYGDFENGARERGVDDDTIKAVWDMIRSFSGYSFVKAHSASYAMLSFQSAYLRAHYPAEFMAAVMSNHGGFYSPLAYASEARRMGLVLLSPDVNESETRCAGKGKAIRFGFGMIRGLGESVARDIVQERSRGGPFASVDDFARRVRFERGDAEALAGSGAFDALQARAASGARLSPGPRAQALMTLLSVYAAREAPSSREPELFESPTPRAASGYRALYSAAERAAGPTAPAALPRAYRQAQFTYLGTTLDCHPLELWPRLFARSGPRARDLPRMVGRRISLLGWAVTAKPVLTAQEEPMEFVSFEDETDIFEAVLFPDAYAKYRHLLFEERPLWIEGLVEKNRGAVTLTIESLRQASSKGSLAS